MMFLSAVINDIFYYILWYIIYYKYVITLKVGGSGLTFMAWGRLWAELRQNPEHFLYIWTQTQLCYSPQQPWSLGHYIIRPPLLLLRRVGVSSGLLRPTTLTRACGCSSIYSPVPDAILPAFPEPCNYLGFGRRDCGTPSAPHWAYGAVSGLSGPASNGESHCPLHSATARTRHSPLAYHLCC